jgi:hypothetical protein
LGCGARASSGSASASATGWATATASGTRTGTASATASRSGGGSKNRGLQGGGGDGLERTLLGRRPEPAAAQRELQQLPDDRRARLLPTAVGHGGPRRGTGAFDAARGEQRRAHSFGGLGTPRCTLPWLRCQVGHHAKILKSRCACLGRGAGRPCQLLREQREPLPHGHWHIRQRAWMIHAGRLRPPSREGLTTVVPRWCVARSLAVPQRARVCAAINHVATHRPLEDRVGHFAQHHPATRSRGDDRDARAPRGGSRPPEAPAVVTKSTNASEL